MGVLSWRPFCWFAFPTCWKGILICCVYSLHVVVSFKSSKWQQACNPKLSSQALWLRWLSGLFNFWWRVSGQIGLGWLVRGTVSNLPLLQFYLDLFWAFWLAALLPSTLLGFSSSLGYLPRLCLRPLLRSDTLLLRSICMSQRPSDDGEILDLTCTFQSLRISIRGPSSQASEALSVLTTHFGGTRRSSSPAPTDSSFDLVGSTAAPSVPVVSGPDTRVSLERGFPACPPAWLQQSSRLSGANLSGQGRLERAWKAGCWASVVQAGRIGSPNSTPAGLAEKGLRLPELRGQPSKRGRLQPLWRRTSRSWCRQSRDSTSRCRSLWRGRTWWSRDWLCPPRATEVRCLSLWVPPSRAAWPHWAL